MRPNAGISVPVVESDSVPGMPGPRIPRASVTTPSATGTVGQESFVGLTLASLPPGEGLGDFWPGSIAEVICYGAILPAASKAALRSYLSGRYRIAMT
jgi:hypothetical protein